jgi:two-component system, NarL family, sensor histidine kinase DevS
MTFAHELAWRQRPAHELDVVREPDRAAAELQDQVIQAIFAAGLHLQSTAAITVDPLVRRRVEKAIGDLDDIIRVIRDSVFGLDHRLKDHRLRTGIVHPCEHPPPPTSPSNGR